MQKECENDHFASLSESTDLGSSGHWMVQPVHEKLMGTTTEASAPDWKPPCPLCWGAYTCDESRIIFWLPVLEGWPQCLNLDDTPSLLALYEPYTTATFH